MKGRLTVFESPDTLAKRWNLDADGKPQKTAAAQLSSGTYQVLDYGDVDDVAALWNACTTRQALCLSLPVDGSVSGRITSKRRAERGAKIRCKAEFSLMPYPGLLFIDSDEGGLSRDELWRKFAN